MMRFGTLNRLSTPLGSTTMQNVTDHLVEDTLSSGGDERLRLSGPERLNGYGCAFRPVDQVSFSSCTASSIGVDAFDRVKSLMLHDANRTVDWPQRFQSVRDQIRAIIGLEDDVDIALGPSGTDLEAIATLACALKFGALTNIVMAPDEIGSGSLLAASGKYFAKTTPLSGSCRKGDWIPGFEALAVSVVGVPVRRESTGLVLPDADIESRLQSIINEAVDAGRTALLHLVYMSKTGLVTPSLQAVRALKARYGDRLQVVVDCCQGRISRDDLNALLEQGFLVLFTGSKFYSGPPFSGALFLPRSVAEVFRKKVSVPAGLSHFFSRTEFPFQWIAFDQVLSDEPNAGLYYRWEAALHEMTLFYRTNQRKFSQTARIFDEVFREVVERCEFLTSLTPLVKVEGADELSQFLLSTIKTVEIHSQGLTFEGVRQLHQKMAQDEVGGIGRIHLGQPVKVKRNASGEWTPVLRFAIGSHFFVENSGKVESIQRKHMLDQLGRAVDKLATLLAV